MNWVADMNWIIVGGNYYLQNPDDPRTALAVLLPLSRDQLWSVNIAGNRGLDVLSGEWLIEEAKEKAIEAIEMRKKNEKESNRPVGHDAGYRPAGERREILDGGSSHVYPDFWD